MIKIKLDAADAIETLRDLSRRADNPREPLREIGAAWKSQIQINFRAGRNPWGGKWARLKPSTIAKRRRGSDLPLRDTGRLSRSFSSRVVGSRLEIGTNVEYAATHQFGASKGQYGRTRRGAPIPWGRVPNRPMLPIISNRVSLPRSWAEEAVEIMRDHLDPH